MRVQCENKPKLIDIKSFRRNEKIGTEMFETDIIKNSVDMFVKSEFINDEKFENV